MPASIPRDKVSRRERQRSRRAYDRDDPANRAPPEPEVAEAASLLVAFAGDDDEGGVVGVGRMDDGRGDLFWGQGIVCEDALKLGKGYLENGEFYCCWSRQAGPGR